MKFFVRYKWKRPTSSGWFQNSVTVTATSDYMAEKIVQGKHPGCEVIIISIEQR